MTAHPRRQKKRVIGWVGLGGWARLANSQPLGKMRAHSHENGKVKVVVTQSHIRVHELPKKEAVGYAYDWLRSQQRKKEEEEKKLKKLDRKLKKHTKHRKK